MKRTALTLGFALALGFAACGSEEPTKEKPDDGAGGGGGEGGTVVDPSPVFAGIASTVVNDRDVRVRWLPATDDVTPAEELIYTVHYWESNPDREPDARYRTYVLDKGPGACNPSCEYVLSSVMIPNDVRWFAVSVTDADGNSTPKVEGDLGELIASKLPAVNPGGAPVIDSWEKDTEEVAAGTVITLKGNYLLDEPTGEDVLLIGDLAVKLGRGGASPEAGFLESWSNREVSFSIPSGYPGGPITLKTPAGDVATESIDIVTE